jgi:Ca2+-binding EF-hand superfamily protein
MKKALLLTLLAAAVAAPVAEAARPSNRKIDALFNLVDVNDDNLLDELEFFATQGKKASAAFSRFRFNKTDVNDDGFVDLTEFRATRAGAASGRPTLVEIFILCDQDDSGTLDPLEYSESLRQRTPWSKVLLAFGKRDRDDSGGLTPREFGIRRFPLL